MRSKRAIYNIITNLVMQGAAIVYGFAIPKVILYYFGSDVNGLVSSVTQFLAYISLLESGFGPVVKSALYKPIANKDKKTIADIIKTSEKFFRRIAFIFVLYIIVLCIILPIIAREKFNVIFTISLVVIMAISTFSEYYFGMAYRLFLRAKQKTYVISIIQSISYILSVLVAVILALIGCNILIIELAVGLAFLIRPLAQSFYVRKKYRIDLKCASSNYPVKQKWDGLSQHVAAVIHGNTDVVVLTVFTTLADVSVYSVYHLVVVGVNRIVQSFDSGLDASFGDMIAKKENDNLRKKFSAYELLYMMIVTSIFATTILMITPFVEVYTNGIIDADYYRPVFGCLVVISEFIWAIRLPYNSITLAAGHFKETKKGAWVEAIINIVISIILVFNFGLVGVAIGTMVAMFVRGVEYVYHANKYILGRSIWESVKKISITVIATIAIVLVMNCIKFDASASFGTWIICALITFLVASVITLLLFFIFYKKDFKAISRRLRRMFRKKR